MKNNYPDEWLVIVDYDLDDSGYITAGVVNRHSKNKKDICIPPIVDKSVALRYTSESNFSGLRSHAYN